MSKSLITNQSKAYELMKARFEPKLGSRTILTDSVWGYVELWISRTKSINKESAAFYWNQARDFYKATKFLDESASPLTAYYCCLNASKSLLVLKGIDPKLLKSHGVSSSIKTLSAASLFNQLITFNGSGVLYELSKYFMEDLKKESFRVADLLYNIPCIHRAFISTYQNKSDLFIPVNDLVFVRIEKSNKAYLQYEIEKKNFSVKTLSSIPSHYERDIEYEDKIIIRSKNRFDWDIHASLDERIAKMEKYHSKIRSDFHYIFGSTKLWYIKKSPPRNLSVINKGSITLIYSVMHFLSELVRYCPDMFNKITKTKQNWLIHEFLEMALDQFVDEISAEITGENIFPTRTR